MNPVAEMREGGTYDVPAGSWSDDTIMPFCLLESIAHLKRKRGGDWAGGNAEGMLATIEVIDADGAWVNRFPAFAVKL